MIMDYAPVKLQTLAVCDDGDICQGIDGTQKSKVWVHSLFNPKKNLVRPPGFEPGLRAWKARIITRLDYGRSRRKTIVRVCDLRVLIEGTYRQVSGRLGSLCMSLSHQSISNRSVEGFDPKGNGRLNSTRRITQETEGEEKE